MGGRTVIKRSNLRVALGRGSGDIGNACDMIASSRSPYTKPDRAPTCTPLTVEPRLNDNQPPGTTQRATNKNKSDKVVATQSSSCQKACHAGADRAAAVSCGEDLGSGGGDERRQSTLFRFNTRPRWICWTA
eukprot:7271717-Prymnesium_polylepis.1